MSWLGRNHSPRACVWLTELEGAQTDASRAVENLFGRSRFEEKFSAVTINSFTGLLGSAYRLRVVFQQIKKIL
jgi:hypothetical protein